MSSLMLQSAPQIDVRTVALQSFRDAVILPVSHRMYTRLAMSKEDIAPESPLSSQPRLQQMYVSLYPQRHARYSLCGAGFSSLSRSGRDHYHSHLHRHRPRLHQGKQPCSTCSMREGLPLRS